MHYYINWALCNLPTFYSLVYDRRSASEMTYIVSGGALNSTTVGDVSNAVYFIADRTQ